MAQDWSKSAETLFDAINEISGAQLRGVRQDKTVDGEVVKIVDIAVGEYKVSYEGNTFSAFSLDSTVTYKVGERVYILVPQGDFSMKKLIIGRSAYRNDLTYDEIQDFMNFYVDKGPNWLSDEYYGKIDELRICAVQDGEEERATPPQRVNLGSSTIILTGIAIQEDIEGGESVIKIEIRGSTDGEKYEITGAVPNYKVQIKDIEYLVVKINGEDVSSQSIEDGDDLVIEGIDKANYWHYGFTRDIFVEKGWEIVIKDYSQEAISVPGITWSGDSGSLSMRLQPDRKYIVSDRHLRGNLIWGEIDNTPLYEIGSVNYVYYQSGSDFQIFDVVNIYSKTKFLSIHLHPGDWIKFEYGQYDFSEMSSESWASQGYGWKIVESYNSAYNLETLKLVDYREAQKNQLVDLNSQQSFNSLQETLWDAHITQSDNILSAYSLTQKYNQQVRVTDSKLTIEQLSAIDSYLQNYNTEYDYIHIKGNFTTHFKSDHNVGEYGVITRILLKNPMYTLGTTADVTTAETAWLTVWQEYLNSGQSLEDYLERLQENSELPYKVVDLLLGFDDFKGSLYFYDNSGQEAYFQIPKDSFVGLLSLYLWQDGQIIADNDYNFITETNSYNISSNNIIVTDLSIRWAEKINLSDSLYYAFIQTPRGINNGAQNVVLEPHLLYQRQDLISAGSCKVRWYVQDARVTTSFAAKNNLIDNSGYQSVLFTSYSDVGWYPVESIIQKYSDPALSPYAIEDETQKLIIQAGTVPYKAKYKAVISYLREATDEQPEQEIERLTTDEVEIINELSDYDLKLVSIEENAKTYLQVIGKKKVDGVWGKEEPYWCEWYVKRAGGEYELLYPSANEAYDSENNLISSGTLSKKKDITSQFVLAGIMTFWVSIYDPQENPERIQSDPIATLTKTITAPDDPDILKVTWSGDDFFQYDAAGCLRNSASLASYTLTPKLEWDEDIALNYKIKIYGPDGAELSYLASYDRQDIVGGATHGYSPENSMMNNIWITPGVGAEPPEIHFKVNEQFDREKTQNRFTLEIISHDNKSRSIFKDVTFVKDGDQGTIGNDWMAPIKPTNYEGTEKFFTQAIDYPTPLVAYVDTTKWVPGIATERVYCQENGEKATVIEHTMRHPIIANSDYRLFLRPFVYRRGKKFEELDKQEGYFYKVYWDVRMPASVENETHKYASFLRLKHANSTDVPNDYYQIVEDADLYENGGIANSLQTYNRREGFPEGLTGFSMYPWVDIYGQGSASATTENAKHGAVEVVFFDNSTGSDAYIDASQSDSQSDSPDVPETGNGTGALLESMNYRLVVKAQIDVYKGVYNPEIGAASDSSQAERIASIHSYYPVDLLLFQSKDAHDTFIDSQINKVDIEGVPRDAKHWVRKLETNWPSEVTYDAAGYNPSVLSAPLYFRFGEDWLNLSSNPSYRAWNLTPLIQGIKDAPIYENNQLVGYKQYYEPKNHLTFTEGFHGVLSTLPVARQSYMKAETNKRDDDFWVTVPIVKINSNGVYYVSYNGAESPINKVSGTLTYENGVYTGDFVLDDASEEIPEQFTVTFEGIDDDTPTFSSNLPNGWAVAESRVLHNASGQGQADSYSFKIFFKNIVSVQGSHQDRYQVGDTIIVNMKDYMKGESFSIEDYNTFIVGFGDAGNSDTQLFDETVYSTPFKDGMYIRGIIMHLNSHDNVDINGWDGQGLDMDEGKGTIFGASIGAGYKDPFTNTFTGVLMGSNKSLVKDRDYDPSGTEEEQQRRKYLTGLFGYQNGFMSFGLLENGTAFFGQANRGGRIIIDGSNATIYGGGQDEDVTKAQSPSIKDEMWNRMRLNLVDLNHSKDEWWYENDVDYFIKSLPESGSAEYRGLTWRDPDNDSSSMSTIVPQFLYNFNPETGITEASANTVAIPGIVTECDKTDNTKMKQGFGGKYFTEEDYPSWYKYLWQRAYIKPDGAPPYWLQVDKFGDFKVQDSPFDSDLAYSYGEDYRKKIRERANNDLYITDFKGQDVNDKYRENRKYVAYRINYYNGVGNLTGKEDWKLDLKSGNQLSLFGPSRASTTPAIEIGQHLHGLMPAMVEWQNYLEIISNLKIPGDRNFLVTYDGTLWSMNAVIIGNVIGSNVIGGRIMGSEIGIGIGDDSNQGYWTLNGRKGGFADCDFTTLEPPLDSYYDVNALLKKAIDTESYINKIKFYVDQSGAVSAKEIHIYGGSVDLGTMHITEEGQFVQSGETDFIGPVHLYGNIGIGPFMQDKRVTDVTGRKTNWKDSTHGENIGSTYGNFFQSRGIVAMGIPIPEVKNGMTTEEALAFHSWLIDNSIHMRGNKLPKYGSDSVPTGGECGPEKFIGIELKTIGRETRFLPKEETLEATTFFGLDTATDPWPTLTTTNPSKYQGHMWPMHFHYGAPDIDTANKYSPGLGIDRRMSAWFTTMNIFKMPAIKLPCYSDKTSVIPGLFNVEGPNYFRVGPWGTEGLIHWIRTEFIPQDSSAPFTDSNALGYFGLSPSNNSSNHDAIGITSIGRIPIILNSSGHSAYRSLDYIRLEAVKQANPLPAGTGGYLNWAHTASPISYATGIELKLGSESTRNDSLYPNNNVEDRDDIGQMTAAKTRVGLATGLCGPISLCSWEDFDVANFANEFDLVNDENLNVVNNTPKAGLLINPCGLKNQPTGVTLWTDAQHRRPSSSTTSGLETVPGHIYLMVKHDDLLSEETWNHDYNENTSDNGILITDNFISIAVSSMSSGIHGFEIKINDKNNITVDNLLDDDIDNTTNGFYMKAKKTGSGANATIAYACGFTKEFAKAENQYGIYARFA